MGKYRSERWKVDTGCYLAWKLYVYDHGWWRILAKISGAGIEAPCGRAHPAVRFADAPTARF